MKRLEDPSKVDEGSPKRLLCKMCSGASAALILWVALFCPSYTWASDAGEIVPETGLGERSAADEAYEANSMDQFFPVSALQYQVTHWLGLKIRPPEPFDVQKYKYIAAKKLRQFQGSLKELPEPLLNAGSCVPEVTFTINRAGIAIGCGITKSSGSQELDIAIRRILENIRFDPLPSSIKGETIKFVDVVPIAEYLPNGGSPWR